MKILIRKGMKRFLAGAIVATLFVLVPTVFNFVFSSIQTTYYTTLPASAILSDVDIQVEDMCLGEREQVWLGTRNVGIDNGISANITRELYKLVEVSGRGQVKAKIYEETVDVFIDPVYNASRIQSYDPPLDEGEYFWQLKMNELRLPGGVVRTDFPIIRTNIFEIKKCNYDPI